METINERVRILRKRLDLTQAEFGNRIGLKQNSIALMESADRTVSNQTILSICREFSVNENWLRTGEGAMRASDTYEKEIGDFLKHCMTVKDTDIQKRLILYLSRLTDKEWKQLDLVLDSLLDGKDILKK